MLVGKILFLLACIVMSLSIIDLAYHIRQTIEDEMRQDTDFSEIAYIEEQNAMIEAVRMEDWLWD